MTQTMKRIVGSIAVAAVFTLIIAIDAIFQGNGAGLIAALGTLAIVAVVMYRAAPALEENWQRREQADGQHSMRPTPLRIAGTLILSALLTIFYLATIHIAIVRLLGPGDPVDPADVIRMLLIFTFPGYAVWPSVELRLRR